jgi:hypothetical protein
MKNPFQIFSRVVYGSQKLYPANEAAHKFAHLLGVKTFSDRQVDLIKDLGFEIQAVQDPTARIPAMAVLA